MKLLFNMATRARPTICFPLLKDYIAKLSGKHEASFKVVFDDNDMSMNNAITLEYLKEISPIIQPCVYSGPRSKINAINAFVSSKDDFDIVINLSDDMIPLVSGYDDIIASDMIKYWPNLDGAPNYDDCFSSKDKQLITLSIMGKKLFDAFGYIYHSDYKSYFSDDEFTDTVKALGKYKFIPSQIIEHRHHGKTPDDLFRENDKFYQYDQMVYIRRKRRRFDLDRVAKNLGMTF